MPKYVHPDALDRGLVEIRDNADQMLVITSYAQGDAYAVVNSRSVCSIPMVPADMALGARGTLDRQITVAAKTGTATAASPPAPDLHLALVDSTGGRVLAVGNETSDQQIVNGNPIQTPQWFVIASQPV